MSLFSGGGGRQSEVIQPYTALQPGITPKLHTIDKFQINEINVDLRTSGFDNEVLSVDACAV